MDEVIIGIGINDNKKTWFPMDKRLEMIRGLLQGHPECHRGELRRPDGGFCQRTECRVYRARHSYRA